MLIAASTPPVHESLTNVIDYLPGAALLLDVDGDLYAANRQALDLLGLERPGGSLFDHVAEPNQLRAILRRTCRGGGYRPLAFRLVGRHGRIGAVAKPVREGPGSQPTHLLLHCEGGDDLQTRMHLLNHELTTAIEREEALRRQNEVLRQAVEETLPRLRKQSYRDSLTNVYNRRYFDCRLRREWRRAGRQGGELSLVYADIDEFKAFNDAHGHQHGDRCLQAVGRALAAVVAREFDCVCRLGGEEFGLLLPMTGSDGALKVAHRARLAFHRLAIAHPAGSAAIVTASFGVGTCRPGAGGTPAAFVAGVDDAMYRAKRAGRDRVVVAGTCRRRQAGQQPA